MLRRSSTRTLEPLEVKILAAAPAFPGGGYSAENVLKPTDERGHHLEYASRGQGVHTFIDFDLGREVPVAAFRHVQRKTNDTVAEANLIFSDLPDFSKVLATVKIKHVDEPEAATFAAFAPQRARYVRWQVTSVLPHRSRNVGGRSIEFFAGGQIDTMPNGIGIEGHTVSIIDRQGTGLVQPLKVTLAYPYAEAVQAEIRVTGQSSRPVDLKYGVQTLRYTVPATDAAWPLDIEIRIDGKKVASQNVTIPSAPS